LEKKTIEAQMLMYKTTNCIGDVIIETSIESNVAVAIGKVTELMWSGKWPLSTLYVST